MLLQFVIYIQLWAVTGYLMMWTMWSNNQNLRESQKKSSGSLGGCLHSVSSKRSYVQKTLHDFVVRALTKAHKSLKKLKQSSAKECETCRDAGRVVITIKKKKPLEGLHSNNLMANQRRNRAPRTLFGCPICKISLCNHKQCWDRRMLDSNHYIKRTDEVTTVTDKATMSDSNHYIKRIGEVNYEFFFNSYSIQHSIRAYARFYIWLKTPSELSMRERAQTVCFLLCQFILFTNNSIHDDVILDVSLMYVLFMYVLYSIL